MWGDEQLFSKEFVKLGASEELMLSQLEGDISANKEERRHHTKTWMQESVKVKRVTILRGYVIFNDVGDFFNIMQINSGNLIHREMCSRTVNVNAECEHEQVNTA